MLNDILLAAALVTGIGLICGILLALASKFMNVKREERFDMLRSLLPGANCGACGYTGCDGYAKALLSGKVKTNLCVPGADSVSKKLSEALGVKFEDVIEQVAFVHCNGNCDAVKDKQVYHGIESCVAANLIYGGTLSCTYGCLGYGDCQKVCPENAICIEDSVARVDTRKCIGCGLCVKTCPNNLITLFSDINKTVVMCSNKEKGASTRKHCVNGCIGCKKCELNCPSKAVKVIDNLAVIDYDKCTGCGICVSNCPVKCIKESDFSGMHRFKDE